MRHEKWMRALMIDQDIFLHGLIVLITLVCVFQVYINGKHEVLIKRLAQWLLGRVKFSVHIIKYKLQQTSLKAFAAILIFLGFLVRFKENF